MLSISETDFFQDISFLQSIAASIQEGVIILNREGKIISCNKQAGAILHLDRDQIVNKQTNHPNWKAINIDGSPLPADSYPVSVTLRTGKPQSNIILGLTKENHPLQWLSISSRLVHTNDEEAFVFATFTDVTTLITSNRLLQEEQDKFSKSFHSSAIGMAIVSPDAKLLDVNEAFYKMLGYEKEELLQKTVQDITPADDLEKDMALIQQMLNREIETYQLEKKYFHKDGHTVSALLTVSLVWDAGNEPHFFVSQIQEITEIKKLNTWLEERNLELQKTESALKRKIGQLKDFAGIITHDVRGPAGNIKKMLEIYETSTDPEIKNTSFGFLKKISNDLTNNLNELIHILQIHLEKDIPYTDCDFAAITDSACLQLQDIVTRKNARIIKIFEIASINYPKIYLQSILYNLISNSLKYSQPEIEPVIRIHTFSKDNKTYLTVSDNGLGIDMKKFSKSLFRFQKSFHSGYDSKGIGLYLVRSQIEDLGGAITAESEVNIGTSFTIRF